MNLPGLVPQIPSIKVGLVKACMSSLLHCKRSADCPIDTDVLSQMNYDGERVAMGLNCIRNRHLELEAVFTFPPVHVRVMVSHSPRINVILGEATLHTQLLTSVP